jgi:hypothetical protein
MSKTKALQEMCKACIYDKACPGTWREQVEACESKHCPLWQHRPLTVATINLHRKTKAEVSGIDLDALIDGLEDEDDEVTAPVAAQ